jgi:hypothetical protein
MKRAITILSLSLLCLSAFIGCSKKVVPAKIDDYSSISPLSDTAINLLGGWTIVPGTDIWDTAWSGKSVFFNEGMWYNFTNIDTAKIIMLYTDTANYYPSDRYKTETKSEWMYGYLVYKFNSDPIYLDNNKSPLKKSIIVWLSKQL